MTLKTGFAIALCAFSLLGCAVYPIGYGDGYAPVVGTVYVAPSYQHGGYSHGYRGSYRGPYHGGGHRGWR